MASRPLYADRGASMATINEICWIDGNPPPHLAVVLRPRGGEWLEDELRKFKTGGIHTLVSLLEEDEAVWLGLGGEPRVAAALGLQFLSFPIPDTQIPSNPSAFRVFVAGLVSRLRRGERIGVHCRGSIGRSTLTAAAALIHLGWKPAVALAAIEKARGCPVPDTEEQHAWILGYDTRP
jgi:protein-tyrosine phosphatase